MITHPSKTNETMHAIFVKLGYVILVIINHSLFTIRLCSNLIHSICFCPFAVHYFIVVNLVLFLFWIINGLKLHQISINWTVVWSISMVLMLIAMRDNAFYWRITDHCGQMAEKNRNIILVQSKNKQNSSNNVYLPVLCWNSKQTAQAQKIVV